MPQTDLSIVVTVHNESVVSGPTMRSADLAIARARAAGFIVQPVIALDKATPDCRAYFHQPAFDHWARWEVEQGDLGRARNEVIAKCDGENIAFLDADDLFSENWLERGLELIQAGAQVGEERIAHPELNWLFDGEASVYVKIDQDDPLFSPHHFAFTNYYDSLCMSPRDAHLACPYVHRDIPNGLSFQDWQYSVETMAAGYVHRSARDTIIFKRRRDFSLVIESRNREATVRAIEPLAIDRIAMLGRKGGAALGIQ
ncbi:glycosyltransferase [Octadecabacter sp. G9-8]|uniref:Glycosyltransferase n=1 Tax=Octadecabacter dasysiphoniae TaxID=2909341 RepID=A0ABS9CUP0_9RHOB|nr:glycosyltransferase [Octadecabacter dasysiphoniae]MCF2870965.1 glycosyltransferase [Octadecabacter dasysiphoniae]